MSIRGIDTQLMVNRTVELAKDVNAMQRREQVAQEQFAQQLKITTEEQSAQVQDVQETEGGKINNDDKEKDEANQGRAQEDAERKAAEDGPSFRDDGRLDASLRPGEDDSGMRIDIRV